MDSVKYMGMSTCKRTFKALHRQEMLYIIAGPLPAVSALVRGVIGGDLADRTYSWNPSFSIDLTDVEPNVAYCIIIHNITCGSEDFVISDCSLHNTVYISQDIQPHLVYRVEVIPRSNVESARNGTPLSVDGVFVNYTKCSKPMIIQLFVIQKDSLILKYHPPISSKMLILKT